MHCACRVLLYDVNLNTRRRVRRVTMFGRHGRLLNARVVRVRMIANRVVLVRARRMAC